MKIWSQLSAQEQQALLARAEITQSETLTTQVKSILEQVKQQGDAALLALTAQFDGVRLSQLSVPSEAIEQAYLRLSESRRQALINAYNNIYQFHQAQVFQPQVIETQPGVICELRSEAIDSVGLYIPAGSAPLPSTVLMLGVPAQIAGCQRVVLVCPPNPQGQLADEVLVAAKLCNITEIYTLGGAQAVAALAYGTETIKPVNKVFGPGNRFVTEAKKQLAQQVAGFAIDMPAGPSEVLVIADAFANPVFIAADLLSQAEHGPDSQVVLVSDSEQIITQTQVAIEQQLSDLPRRAIAEKALANSRFILADDLKQAVEISNQYGPEHLIVQCKNAQQLLANIRHAGSIFVGDYTPESAGDYASGTNHVLPTYGYSKVVSSLSLADFSRRFTVQTITQEGLAQLAPTIIELTNAEGLMAHQRAVTLRLTDLTTR
jgi:histidinol dehydrogenase